MTDILRTGPLEGYARPGRHGAASGLARLTLAERRGLRLLLIRGHADRPAFFQGVREALGLDLPPEPNTSSADDRGALLWLGPDEWLHVGHPGAGAADALAACASAVVDVSHGRAVMRIAGPHAADALAKGLPLDLRPHAFPAGCCAQSVMARCNVLVHRLDDTPAYDVFVMRSYGRSVWHFLCEAAAEYGYETVPPVA